MQNSHLTRGSLEAANAHRATRTTRLCRLIVRWVARRAAIAIAAASGLVAASEAAAATPPALSCSSVIQKPYDPVGSYINGHPVPAMGYCLSYDGQLLYGGTRWGGEGPLPHGGWAEVVYTNPNTGEEFFWRGDDVRPIDPGTVIRSAGVNPAFPGRYCVRFISLREDGSVSSWHEGHCITL